MPFCPKNFSFLFSILSRAPKNNCAKYRVGNLLITHFLSHSNPSGQISEYEPFAQVAQEKWANVSDSLRSLWTNEWLWANCSRQMSECEQFAQVAQHKRVNKQIAHKKRAIGSKNLNKFIFFTNPKGKKWSSHFDSFRVSDWIIWNPFRNRYYFIIFTVKKILLTF